MLVTQDALQLKPGHRIGEYEIIEIIGSGGFSLVYKAHDTNLARAVAIKQFHPDVFSEAGTRDWFFREARLAASLTHPNIVATYALREEHRSLFLVMEYLPGGDLHTLVAEQGPFDRETLLRVARDACHALDTLHARGIIHRDIKPENILIAEDGSFKLADFGLAHIRQAQTYALNAASGPQPGTLLYMSPEQAYGEEITVQSDLYSLAVVLYEAMTGHYYLDLPHGFGDEEALLIQIAQDEPLFPARHHPSVPDALAEPLLRALSKDPARRPNSARAFFAEIKAALAPTPRPAPALKRRLPAVQADQHQLSEAELADEIKQIRALRDAQQPAQAEARLRALGQSYARLPEVAAEWGETLLALGDVEGGCAWLERAIAQKPDLPLAQLALARHYSTLGTHQAQSWTALIAAIRADPDLAYATLYPLLCGPVEPARFGRLLALFEAAAQQQPTAPILHNLGQVLALAHGREEESIAAFEQAIALDPTYGPTYVGYGSLLIEMGEVEEAIRVLEPAIDYRFPPQTVQTVYQQVHAYLALAIAYAQNEQYEHSAFAASIVHELNADELEEDAESLLDAYASAASAWMKAGDPVRAYRFLTQIVPLAATWGHVETFTLLSVAERRVSPPDRVRSQWDDALGWLKSSVLRLHRQAARRASSPASE